MRDRFLNHSPRELARMENLLLTDLKAALAGPHSDETRSHLASLLDSLFELLPARFSMIENGGYLREVVRKFPNWRNQVEALRVDHALLYEDLRESRRRVNDAESFQEAAPQVMERVAEWLDHLERHEAEERRLSQLATNLEIGACD